MYKQYRFLSYLTATFLILVLLCCVMVATGHAEQAASPSITADDLYRVVSPYMEKSRFPIDLYEFECIRIDLNTDEVPMGNVIDGEFFFPALPTTLEMIFLSDGYHLVPSQWHWTDADRIYISFDVADIANLDTTIGLFIFLFAYH